MADQNDTPSAASLAQAGTDAVHQAGSNQAEAGNVEQALSGDLSRVKELGRGRVNIEIKASFELDDARVFDLNGGGLTIAAIASN